MQRLIEDKYSHISSSQIEGNRILIFVTTLLTGFLPINRKHHICPHLKIWSSVFNILCLITWNSFIMLFTTEKHGFIVGYILLQVRLVAVSPCIGSQIFLTKEIEQ